MTVDIAFTTDKTGIYEVPLVVTGSCTGAQVLLQKVVMLMLASTDDTLRYEGGLLYDNLRGANVSEGSLDRLENLINIAITDTVEIIREEQKETSLPTSERLDELALTGLSIPQEGSLYLELTITNAESEELKAVLNI